MILEPLPQRGLHPPRLTMERGQELGDLITIHLGRVRSAVGRLRREIYPLSVIGLEIFTDPLQTPECVLLRR
jgi:hypothetical protein